MSHTVRTTMRPDLEIEVGDADYLDLQRQGLLVEEEPAPAVNPTTKKASGLTGTKES